MTAAVVLSLLALASGCSSPAGQSKQITGKVHRSQGRKVSRTNQAASPPEILSSPKDAWLASVRVFVPVEVGKPTTRQGVGVKLADGSVITALHVFGEKKTVKRRIQSARIEAFHNGQRSSISKSRVTGDNYRDTAIIQPGEHVNTKLVVRPAADSTPPGSLAHALLMSTRRGDRTWTISTATVLGYSQDKAFFAIAGPATEGDSGGPVLNDEGELIGIVIGGGAEEIGFPFRVEWLPDGHFRTIWLDAPSTKLYKGAFTICARPELN